MFLEPVDHIGQACEVERARQREDACVGDDSRGGPKILGIVLHRGDKARPIGVSPDEQHGIDNIAAFNPSWSGGRLSRST